MNNRMRSEVLPVAKLDSQIFAWCRSTESLSYLFTRIYGNL
ncbi:hypothetical protein [uncultured Vibrio sp.]|nr:hypothetical protein [uncultured Vibrio sp.]